MAEVTKCVVCGLAIDEGAEKYSNSWESARKRFPCCSPECCAAFDPSVHWIPAHAPDPADAHEEAKLLPVARNRLRNGDSPTVVTREMLQAGIAVPALRKLLTDAHIAGSRSRDDAASMSLLGGLTGLFTGLFGVGVNTDKRKPASLEDALDDVGRWEAHFANAE